MEQFQVLQVKTLRQPLSPTKSTEQYDWCGTDNMNWYEASPFLSFIFWKVLMSTTVCNEFKNTFFRPVENMFHFKIEIMFYSVILLRHHTNLQRLQFYMKFRNFFEGLYCFSHFWIKVSYRRTTELTCLCLWFKNICSSFSGDQRFADFFV